MGQQQASPLAIVIAILVLLVVMFALYKLTIDKPQAAGTMDKGGKMMMPGAPMPGMMGNSTSAMPAMPAPPPPASTPGS